MPNSVEKTPKISIIIPVYQCREYLSQCIDSVLKQSFDDWELILVDDGSTDGSEQLCDDYASSSDKIRVVHQKNGGISAGRNTGLDIARGEFIAMIDADDILLDCDYLSLMYYSAIDEQAEISMCKHNNFYDENNLPDPSGSRKVAMTIRGEDAFFNGIFPRNYYIDVSHGKLFRRSLFKDARYPIGRNMEDSSIMHRLVFPCKKIVLVDATMYGHRVHSASVFHSNSSRSLAQDLIYGLQERIQFFESMGRHDLAHHSEQKLLHFIMNQDNLKRIIENRLLKK